MFTCQISSETVYSSAFDGRKIRIFKFNSLCGTIQTKLNVGAQLQAFPYPTIQTSNFFTTWRRLKSQPYQIGMVIKESVPFLHV